MVKAVFFDIDGTMVSYKTHKVPQSTVDALGELRKKGIKTFVASGRHKVSINNLDGLEFDGYVTLNGGINSVNDKIIYKHGIPKKDIQALLNYVNNVESFPCIFVHEKELLMNYRNKTTDDVFALLNFPTPPVQELTDEKEVFQAIAFFTKQQEKQIMQALPHCDETRWNPLFTDIIPKGGSKWIGIKHMLEYFDINEDETMAFGDGGNDIEMLTNIHIGVAMGNAEDDVKASADYVTDDVDSDGILKALKHFGLL